MAHKSSWVDSAFLARQPILEHVALSTEELRGFRSTGEPTQIDLGQEFGAQVSGVGNRRGEPSVQRDAARLRDDIGSAPGPKDDFRRLGENPVALLEFLQEEVQLAPPQTPDRPQHEIAADGAVQVVAVARARFKQGEGYVLRRPR